MFSSLSWTWCGHQRIELSLVQYDLIHKLALWKGRILENDFIIIQIVWLYNLKSRKTYPYHCGIYNISIFRSLKADISWCLRKYFPIKLSADIFILWLVYTAWNSSRWDGFLAQIKQFDMMVTEGVNNYRFIQLLMTWPLILSLSICTLAWVKLICLKYLLWGRGITWFSLVFFWLS